MPRKPQSRGICSYCNQEFAKGKMTEHLAKCTARAEEIKKAEQKKGAPETLFYLRVQDAWHGDFWLDLEMSGTATLKKLDAYLRSIWLECCGHMSEFSGGGRFGGEIAMSRPANKVFAEGVELLHIYDFGTSSETKIKFVSQRTGVPTTRHPIALMARNVMPVVPCQECGQPAAWICQECICEDDASGWLCDTHVTNHPHDDYGEPMPLVNSPRAGVCGYEGPAEPPY